MQISLLRLSFLMADAYIHIHGESLSIEHAMEQTANLMMIPMYFLQ